MSKAVIHLQKNSPFPGSGFRAAARLRDGQVPARSRPRAALEAAKRKFSPEFMNRIDKTVVFKTLRDEHLSQILDIELGMVQQRVLMAANVVIAPTINLQTPAATKEDPTPFDVDLVPNHAKERRTRFVMNNTFGFGGHNATLVIKAFQ